jgi:hypothetical protein
MMFKKVYIMKYIQVKALEEEKFRRLTGVKPSTFQRMVKILKIADHQKKSKGGRKNKLCIEDQLLIALEYIPLSNERVGFEIKTC